MSAAKILLIDTDDSRTERLATLLEFMDATPRIMADAADINLKKIHDTPWNAIIAGDVGAPEAWDAFVADLAKQALPPPLITLPDHPADAAWRRHLHPEMVWALDYPIRRQQLQDMLQRAGNAAKPAASGKSRKAAAPSQAPANAGPSGGSPAVQRLNQMIEQVARFDTTVLILGESGTGKEVAARAIHAASPRAAKPFVAINCGAIPADLLESELFGHEKGAFTGALTQRKGRFEMAEGGTLLLDEIGDMPMAMQVKLLRVLQERVFERVGGGGEIACDVRVIAATHRNLEAHIAEGKFREDLFYRLNVFPIEMPTLKERAADLPELVATITRDLAESGRGQVRLSEPAIAALQQYAWPGNVRELCNLLERLAVLNPDGVVDVDDLPARYRTGQVEYPELDTAAEHAIVVPLLVARPTPAAPVPAAPVPAAVPIEPVAAPPTATPPPASSQQQPPPLAAAAHVALPAEGLDLRQYLADIETDLIRQALQHCHGVAAHAAPLLGLRRTTLLEKMRKYGIERSGEELSTDH
jgi:sigma-54 dependent transcriptional regulator, flagellar regulatory protein